MSSLTSNFWAETNQEMFFTVVFAIVIIIVLSLDKMS